MSIGKDGGVNLFIEEEVDCSFETVIIDILIVVVLLEHRIKAICNDRLRSEFLDEIRLVWLKTS